MNLFHRFIEGRHGKGPLLFFRALPLVPILVLAVLLPAGSTEPDYTTASESSRELVVEGRRFGYDPPVVRVRQGDHVRLVFKSMDVTHGFYLEGYGLSLRAIPGRAQQVAFVADKSGKFTFRCSQVCGNLHPFMTGALIVEPNQPLWLGLALAGLLAIGFLGYMGARGTAGARALVVGNPARLSTPRPAAVWRPTIRFDLTKRRVINWLLHRRALQFALLLPTLLALVLVLIAGFAGSPVGDHNLAIVLVWAVWWPLLIIGLMPLGGRLWCAACPVPAPGEWLQRLAFVRKREGHPLSLGWSWPSTLRSMWPQNLSFLAVAALSAVVSTSPAATAITLSVFVGLAVVLALLFRGRSFCRHLCPLGGFIGLYGLATPVTLRARAHQVCQAHQEKSCMEGNGAGYGCPWYQYPGAMESTRNCGLCMECVKTCPKENIAVGFQTPGTALVHSPGRSDEAFRAAILLSAGLIYTAVMLGPWGRLTLWAGNPWTGGYLLYLGLLLAMSLLVVPGLLLGAAHHFKRFLGAAAPATKQVWVSFSYPLVPLGLLVWMTFAATALSTGASHLPSVISDPLGRGWDLFGTADVKWPALYPDLVPYLQIGGLLAGLAWGLAILKARAERLVSHWRRPAWLGLAPMVFILFCMTSASLWLYLD